MKNYESLKDLFQDTADAIRERGQTEELIIAEDFPDAIRNLPTSSVNIIDIYSAEDLERECAKQEAGKLYRYLGPTIGEYYINDNIYESINGYPDYHQENEYDVPKVKTAEEMEYLSSLYSENQIFQTVQYVGETIFSVFHSCDNPFPYINQSMYTPGGTRICQLNSEETTIVPAAGKIAYNGAHTYVTCGNDSIYFSNDCTFWTEANLPETRKKYSCVIFANNMFVASWCNWGDSSGQHASIIYSYDGVNWFSANRETNYLGGDSIAYGKTSSGINRFVIVSEEGDDNILSYSDDGINWFDGDINGTFDTMVWNAHIFYAKDKFFYMGYMYSNYHNMYSYDGINWVKMSFTDDNASSLLPPDKLIYSEKDNMYIGFGNNNNSIYFSKDGETLDRIPAWNYNWEYSEDKDFPVHFKGDIVDWMYKDGLYIVLTSTGGGQSYLYYSPTIYDWSFWNYLTLNVSCFSMLYEEENNLIKIFTEDLYCDTYQIKETWFEQGKLSDAKMTNNPRFLMDGVNLNRAGTYLDLQNHKIYEINVVEEKTQWKRGGDLPITTYWRDAAASDDGTIVAVGGGDSSGGNINKAAYSTDGGETWRAATLPSTSHWRSVAYGNGKFVATAYTYYTKSDDTGYNYITNRAAYSTNGINWTAATMPTSGCWTVTYGNGKFVAVGGAGYSTNRAAYSTDGVTWTAATMPSAAYWSDVAYGKGLYVAVAGSYSHSTGGTTDKFAYSTDGINWTEGTMPKAMAWNSITFNEKTGYFLATAAGYYNDGLYVTTESLAYSSNGKNWYMMKGSEYNSFMKIITSPYNYNQVLIGRSTSDRKGIYYSVNQTIPQWQNYNGTLNLSLGAGVYAKNKFVVISNNGKESYYCYDNLLDAKKDDVIITEYTGTKIEAV